MQRPFQNATALFANTAPWLVFGHAFPLTSAVLLVSDTGLTGT